MIYSDFKNIKVSKLGFGTMRLPLNDDSSIDQKQVEEMVDLAIASGVNYFDTAWPYHGGLSEKSISKALSKYPKEKYYLADKYPGHQISPSYNPQEIFEKQLQKCKVDYFDFYLLHNIYENDFNIYEDKNLGIIDYFTKQKQLGKIKYLGFSSHAYANNLESFIKRHPKTFDFCQIQLNYVDWDLQDAKRKVEILNQNNIPIWVMEPVRGGKLSNFDENTNRTLHNLRPNCSISSWAFNYLLNIKGINVILSGMSNIEQMKDNIKTFNDNNPLNDEETKIVYEIAKAISNTIPCTKCKYCTDKCPMGLDIPTFISIYNELKIAKAVNAIMALDALETNKHPSACIKCGRCKLICPQKIDIPVVLSDLIATTNTMTSWKEICKQREIESKKNN